MVCLYNSNNVHIDIPRHLSGHLLGISLSFHLLQVIACTHQKLKLRGVPQVLKINNQLIAHWCCETNNEKISIKVSR